MTGFVGFTGADRFFLGYIFLGISKLIVTVVGISLIAILSEPTVLVGYLVFSAAIMWWLVDLVMIVTGRIADSTGTPLI